MAVITLHPSAIFKSGRNGNEIYYKLRKTFCVRTYTKPSNPKTEAQEERRSRFSRAVRSWQKMPATIKNKYIMRAHAAGRKGYNLYITEFMGCNLSESFTGKEGHLRPDHVHSNGILQCFKAVPSPFLLRSVSLSEIISRFRKNTAALSARGRKTRYRKAFMLQESSAYG